MHASSNTLDFARLFAALPARILILRPDAPRFSILGATDAYLAASGKRLEEILNQGLFEVFPDSAQGSGNNGPGLLRASLEKVCSSCIADHLPMLRYDSRNPNGAGWDERYWTPTNSPVFDAGGELIYIVHRVEEATEFVRNAKAILELRGPQRTPPLKPQELEATLLAHSRELQRTNQRLAESEHRFRSLIENMPAMVFRCEAKPPWRVIYASEGIERLSGYPAAHFVEGGLPWASVIHPEDVARVSDEVAAKMAAGLPMRVEYRIVRRDGSEHWVEGRSRATADGSRWLDATVFDIDDRKRTELALTESEEHLRYTLQSVSSGVWTALPDGRIDFVSDAGRTYVGSTPQQRQGDGWLNYVHPDDVERVRARWNHSLQTGNLYDCSFRQAALDGEYHWLQARAISRRDADGKVLRWYGITTDVGELVRMQEQLRESEELASATIQSVPGIVWRARADGQLNFVSDACTAVLGYTPQKMVEEGWNRVIHPEDVAEVQQRWDQALQTGERFESRHRFRNAQGVYRWFQVGAIATRDGKGRISRWHGLATDIEDLLQARLVAESATRAKSVFLSTMSHEIRTPLNAVLGFSGLLADTELDSQQRDFLNSIRASGDHLLGVINDILDYSKLESGSLSLEFAPCDLREVIESALDIVASQAGPKNLELLYRVEADVPPGCRADPTRLRQVLVNLLGNAVKFTPAGEVQVNVSARPLAIDEFEFEFRVRDTGIGIPADQIGRLFRDFSQVDDSVARRFGGTGLGLAISKRLVEAHGGTIKVESQVGVGSTFIFRIPAQVCAAPAALPDTALEHLRGRRVLVVDDNRSNLDFLGLQLRAWGMDPVCMQDPRRAIESLRGALAQDHRFDLAVVDQHMPELDGLQFARLVHAIAPLPVVLMSSLGTTLHSARASGAPIAALQNKPVHRRVLLETLSGLLAPKPVTLAEAGGQAVKMPPLRLLLVEDNLVNRKVALLLLRKLGYDAVDAAVDGAEAVEAVCQKDYDVVLMDVQMPVLDGFGATQRIRREIDAARQPTIIAMTANAMIEDREACLAAGMDDYLAKPIVPAQLTAALLHAARRRGLEVAVPATHLRPTASQDADARAHRIADQVLAGGGEMGALMRSIDWSQNPLGPVYTWPQSLRTALSIVLTQKHPMFLWWGRELIQFYNDAFRPILGSTKHPRAMGQPGRECWTDIWGSIGPLVDGALERGESTMVDHGLLCLFRNGFYEEGYYSYGYSPIRDESGGIGGVLVACSENTAEVLAARRSALLLELDEHIARVGAGPYDGSLALSALESARNDLPFVLMYRIAADAQRAELICSLGLTTGDPAAPNSLTADHARWPVFACAREQREIHLDSLEGLPVLPPWPEPPQRALLLPASDREVLVVGLSARLPFDAAYNVFLTKLAARLGVFARLAPTH